MTKPSPNFDAWLSGLGAVEEDHVFTPVGKQTPEMTRLLNERAAMLEQAATGKLSGDTSDVIGEEAVGEVERAVGESYSESLDDIDGRIAAQLEIDHPDAPRFRLRGLSDDDFSAIQAELKRLLDAKGAKWSDQALNVEANLRMVARSVVFPEKVTTQDVRILRQRLNRGEWARLLSHVTRLANADAEATDLPN